MACSRKIYKLLAANQVIEHGLCLHIGHARIMIAVQDQRGTFDRAGICDGIVLKAVETLLNTSPEH